MKNYIEVFRAFLIEEKNSSKNTLESYLRDINQYSAYCTDNGINDVAKADEAFVRNYIEFLAQAGKSEATRNRIVASLRCYYKCLNYKEIINTDPIKNFHVKKTTQKLPGILDSKEIMLLLNQPVGDDLKSVRDKAMLELLYATGIKVSELIELKVTDVNTQIGILYLHDKKERIIPIYPAAVKSVMNYIKDVRPAIVFDAAEDRLFTNMTGTPMSRQGFWKIIKYYAAKAGIDKDITPHTLRHCFAAHLLENGAQLKDIKEMLGHSDISSTQVYAQFIKNKYTLSYSKYHPLAK